jgi:hypothetical protein
MNKISIQSDPTLTIASSFFSACYQPQVRYKFVRVDESWGRMGYLY